MSYKITKKRRDMLPGETALTIPGTVGESTLRRIATHVVNEIEKEAVKAFGDQLVMLNLEIEVKHSAMVVLGVDEEVNADDNN